MAIQMVRNHWGKTGRQNKVRKMMEEIQIKEKTGRKYGAAEIGAEARAGTARAARRRPNGKEGTTVEAKDFGGRIRDGGKELAKME